MNLRLPALTLTALALIGCTTSVQPSPAAKPTPTSTVGAWEVSMNVINQVGAAGTASFTFADGHTKVINLTESALVVTEKDLVLVGQSVMVEVDVTKPPKDSYVVCTIEAPKITLATEGGGVGTLASSTGTAKFTCTWTNDGTLMMPEPEK